MNALKLQVNRVKGGKGGIKQNKSTGEHNNNRILLLGRELADYCCKALEEANNKESKAIHDLHLAQEGWGF